MGLIDVKGAVNKTTENHRFLRHNEAAGRKGLVTPRQLRDNLLFDAFVVPLLIERNKMESKSKPRKH